MIISRENLGLFLSLVPLFSFAAISRVTGNENGDEQKTRQMLESILKSAPGGIGVVENRVIVQVNDYILNLTGYSREELVGKSARILYPNQEEFDFVGREKYRQIAEKGTGSVETVWQRKDGTLRHVILSSTPLNQADMSKGVTFTVLAITARKKAELELLNRESFQKSLLSAIPVAVFFKDSEGRYLGCNQAFTEIMGVSSKDIAGRKVHELWPSELAERYHQADLELMATRKHQVYEFKVKDKNGVLRPVIYGKQVFYSADGEIAGMVGAFVDISQQKDLQNSLEKRTRLFVAGAAFFCLALFLLLIRLSISLKRQRKTAEELESFFTVNLDLLCIADLDGNFVKTNKAWSSILGYSTEELNKMKFLDFVHEEDIEATLKAMKNLEKGEEVLNFINRYRAKDGSYRHIEWRSNPKGRLIYAAARDITERKHAQEEREKLQTQLNQAQKMESVGRLAGGVAHDFNNMLAVIIGQTELAMKKVAPEKAAYSNLKEIFNAAQRSAGLTRQLLAFARRQPVMPRVLDLNETVQGMIKMLERIIGEDIDMIWLPGNELWPVKIDPTQIDQILANLCVNARDAISGVGKVIIETANVVLNDDLCETKPDFYAGEFVRLTVTDDGIGMDSATILHLFEPFFTTKEVGKGTGLGLATVYGAVRQNKGFIDVYSEPDNGTSFKIFLPRHSLENTPEPGKTSNRVLSTRPGHEVILLVEDDLAMLKTTRIILEDEGYTVLAANSPGEALKMARDQGGRVDILISDVVLPEMNGKDLAHELAKICPKLSCLFMSGYTADFISKHGVLEEGVNFIEKPFVIENLLAKLRTIVKS
ncbi:MAG: PAS domain S-box protein [Candidatus Rifleibacteriota bacterium]